MVNHTKFQKKVFAIAELRRQLKALESNYRLSARAFMAAAVKNAAIDKKRLDALRATVADRAGLLPNLASFVEAMTNELGRSPRYPSPPVKVSRIVGIWGSGAAEIEMREAGMNVLECVAVAVAIATERYPDGFGPVDDPVQHERSIADLRADIAAGHARLREIYEPRDVVIEAPDPLRSAELAKQGFCKIVFRDFPSVSPSSPDWPAQVTDVAIGVPRPVVIGVESPKVDPAMARAVGAALRDLLPADAA
jgi:hypothetical protein